MIDSNKMFNIFNQYLTKIVGKVKKTIQPKTWLIEANVFA